MKMKAFQIKGISDITKKDGENTFLPAMLFYPISLGTYLVFNTAQLPTVYLHDPLIKLYEACLQTSSSSHTSTI